MVLRHWIGCRVLRFKKTIHISTILSQSCILLNYISVISFKFINKFAQKCQYFTLMDQSVPLITVTSLVYLGRNPLWISFKVPLNKKKRLLLQNSFQLIVFAKAWRNLKLKHTFDVLFVENLLPSPTKSTV